MKIALGCDHGGLNLKSEIAKYLESQNVELRTLEHIQKNHAIMLI